MLSILLHTTYFFVGFVLSITLYTLLCYFNREIIDRTDKIMFFVMSVVVSLAWPIFLATAPLYFVFLVFEKIADRISGYLIKIIDIIKESK